MKRSLKAELAVERDQSGRTMADIVYRKLRDDIVSGILAPGIPLRSDEIRTTYETGISPLREALTRLTSEQLVFFYHGLDIAHGRFSAAGSV